MKKFICRTNDDGITDEDLSPEKMALHIHMDTALGRPENALILVSCEVIELKKGYRFLTEK